MERLKLQSVLLPKPAICMEEELYYRKSEKNVELDVENQKLIFKRNGRIFFDTYFNGFSIGKWRKYTILDKLYLNLKLKGHFIISLVYLDMIDGNLFEHVLSTFEVNCNEYTDVKYLYESFEERGMYSFKVHALQDESEFISGYYDTVIEEDLQDISLAINMCTYKLEKYVYQNVETLKINIFENNESIIKDKLQLFITDNGSTVDYKRIKSDKIHMVQQFDAGSAGGFARGMIEILKANKKNNNSITHMIMMDDDVLLDTEVLERNYSFIRMVKEEYKDYVLGGGMLRLDHQYLQHESGGYFDENGYKILKFNKDLRILENVIQNNIDEGATVNAWWYCCIPIRLINENTLPFPLFFHRDDMEFGKRIGGKLILLNGISIWHEAFQNKLTTSSWRLYFDMRNLFIVNAIHFNNYNKRNAKKEISKEFWYNILCYRYKVCDLLLSSIEDFCKGVDWLISQDGEALLEEKIKGDYKVQSIQVLPFKFDVDNYTKNLIYKEKKLKRLFRRLTLNGYILPKNRNVIVPTSYPLKYSFYRAKHVLNYDNDTKSGFITQSSIREVFRLIKRYIEVMRFVNKNYDNIILEYKERSKELTNIKTWTKILKLEDEV
ncbi:galactofuranosylgalactofuranosylrhamnosyl-N-acetylglucosaminyl-diphospho-decaprenol beta-1,5/1,6-galactofuranosyltransferase [Clostridium neonatale]|uniref:hypothetical protein n=1 Tax=Clostridium neonatale TaxID=137838 RepID=UPI00291BDB37|nr:galactofuranosylgalactofuranosylrhamnosyl-N-acetylglucosaminyl-diphospho-decaprenol beta-1,5/1,6-galactofuranosyltransferase [Clostridium neonatale]CAI3670185.1 galactofuranosylgalactofuranosylrhamnosyl-N-acetylglucosaminyl-diphospho-decaprenol beta-1,5/1,6-galactofuranosyltransferase [Clostridium neonatale]